MTYQSDPNLIVMTHRTKERPTAKAKISLCVMYYVQIPD